MLPMKQCDVFSQLELYRNKDYGDRDTNTAYIKETLNICMRNASVAVT